MVPKCTGRKLFAFSFSAGEGFCILLKLQFIIPSLAPDKYPAFFFAPALLENYFWNSLSLMKWGNNSGLNHSRHSQTIVRERETAFFFPLKNDSFVCKIKPHSYQSLWMGSIYPSFQVEFADDRIARNPYSSNRINSITPGNKVALGKPKWVPSLDDGDFGQIIRLKYPLLKIATTITL